MSIDEILALLRRKFTGVRNDVLTNIASNIAMAVDTKEDAEKLVEKLDISKVEAFAKEYRRGIDREITDANKTHEEGLRKKYDFKDKNTNPGGGSESGTEDQAKMIAEAVSKAVATAMAPVNEFMTSYNATTIRSGRRSRVENMFQGVNVPKSYQERILKDFDRMSFDTDEAFDAFLTETKTDVDAYVQEMADTGLAHAGGISMGQRNKDGISAGVAQYIESEKAKTSNDGVLSGKEL